MDAISFVSRMHWFTNTGFETEETGELMKGSVKVTCTVSVYVVLAIQSSIMHFSFSETLVAVVMYGLSNGYMTLVYNPGFTTQPKSSTRTLMYFSFDGSKCVDTVS